MARKRLTLGYVAMGIPLLFLTYHLIVDGVSTTIGRAQYAVKAAAMTKQVTDLEEAKRHPIALSGDSAKIQQAYDALLRKVAMPGEAARANKALHVVLVSGEPSASSFADVSLDIEELSHSGLLLVTDTPIAWRIKGSKETQRAKLAFESRAPFFAPNMRQGLLTAFRVQGYRVGETIGPDSFDEERTKFCEAMAGWQLLYRQPPSSVQVWKIYVAHGDKLTANDGGLNDARHVGRLSEFCTN